MYARRNSFKEIHYDKTRICVAFLIVLISGMLSGCDGDQNATGTLTEKVTNSISSNSDRTADPYRARLSTEAMKLFGVLPMPAADSINQAAIDLGRMLFHDPRLSVDGETSCNSCHNLMAYGISPQNQAGGRNIPTVYNSHLNIAQNWDGSAEDLKTQARESILSTKKMSMDSEGSLVTRIAVIPGYTDQFEAAFPDDEIALNLDNIAAAIASFEAGLLTPGRFDDFMQGNLNALTSPELHGLELFIQSDCGDCHNGPALGGRMFQKAGLTKPFTTNDPGRFAVTGNEEDRGVFKVPGLRNVSRTAPYFHDGSVMRLVDAIQLMGEHQLGTQFTAADLASIAMFLESLTGTPDATYIATPDLPAEPTRTTPLGAS